MVDGVGIDLGVCRKSLEFAGDIEQFVQNEVHVAQGRVVLTHGVLLYLVGQPRPPVANSRFKQTFK
jgi:hypothetical protein